MRGGVSRVSRGFEGLEGSRGAGGAIVRGYVCAGKEGTHSDSVHRRPRSPPAATRPQRTLRPSTKAGRPLPQSELITRARADGCPPDAGEVWGDEGWGWGGGGARVRACVRAWGRIACGGWGGVGRGGRARRTQPAMTGRRERHRGKRRVAIQTMKSSPTEVTLAMQSIDLVQLRQQPRVSSIHDADCRSGQDLTECTADSAGRRQ